jgi:hypothetical protein
MGTYFTDLPDRKLASVRLHITESVSAGSSKEWPAFQAPYKLKINSVKIIPQANITGADTNNFKIQVLNKGTNGTGTTVIFEKEFANGTNASAFIETSIPLKSGASNIVSKGEGISVKKLDQGTGMDCPEFVVVFDLEVINTG